MSIILSSIRFVLPVFIIKIFIPVLISLPGCMADPHPSASFLRCRRDIYLSRSEENSPSVDRGTGLALVGVFVIYIYIYIF